MALSILLIVAAILGGAVISASETALLASSKIKLRARAAAGDKRAERVVSISKDPEKFFGAVLLVNNILQMLLGAITTSLAIKIGGNTAGVVAAATIISTAVIVLFGDLTPKTLAAVFPETVALAVARPLQVLTRITWPVVWGFALLPWAITKLLGGDPSRGAPTVTGREIRLLIDVGEEEGTVGRQAGVMLENIFRFGETEVRDVMTPRTDIIWVQADTTLKEFTDTYYEHAHIRYPVYDEDHDDVVGILSVKDVLAALSAGNLDWSQSVARMAREALFVPETKRLDDLFKLLQQSGHKMALIVDEFGSVSGVMTLNAVLEQIVGRTGEEGGKPAQRFVMVDENTLMLDGGMTINEANEALGLKLPEGEYNTVAGYLLEQLQSVPVVGDRVRHGEMRLQVAEMDGKRIAKVRVRRRAKTDSTESASAA